MRLVSPLLLAHYLWRTLQDGGWQYARERLGFGKPDSQQRIHVHAASVGEVITVLPLLEVLQEQQPDIALLVTTNTPTGAKVLKSRTNSSVKHAYLPIDLSGSTKRFFRRNNLSESWIVETEIWPWLFTRAKQNNTPIKIINARLSPKSQGAIAQFFEATYAQALAGVAVLARSEDDANRYIEQGAQSENVATVGNLKLANTTQAKDHIALIELPYVLAASTHGDEEIRVAHAWLNATDKGLLVIAPRHAERGAQLRKGLHVLQQELETDLAPPALRSLGQAPTASCRLYIADTLGELENWYAYSSAAFVGGSLIDRGGHNVLEPARTNTPIIVGPSTYNFVEEVNSLKAVNAIAIGNNADEVVALLLLSQSNPQWAQQLSNNALALVTAESSVIDAYLATLLNSQ